MHKILSTLMTLTAIVLTATPAAASTPVPEPGTIGLLGAAALAGAVVVARRKK